MLGYARASAGVFNELKDRHQVPISRISYLVSDHQDLVAYVMGRTHGIDWSQAQPQYDHVTQAQLAVVCASLTNQLDASDANDRAALVRLESVLEHIDISHLLVADLGV